MTKVQRVLNENREELKADIVTCTLKELAFKYDISRDSVISFIRNDEELNSLYTSNKRKKFLYENRDSSQKRKYRDKCKEGVHLFTRKLQRKGVYDLAEAVLVRAIKDRDYQFFNSERFDFWQQYCVSQKSREYYINCIGRVR